MPTLQIPLLLKDRDVERETERMTGRDWTPFELRAITVESLLPGPVSDRVAVVDIRDGRISAAAKLPATNADLLPKTLEPFSEPDVVRWSVFATVLETLTLFERPDCLGRVIPWAFGRSQLLVVPEAAEDANAFYDRSSGSLQLGYFLTKEGEPIHAAACHDIVAHETAHAVLDGIAPWLFDASGPEAVALHESVADLTALFASASSPVLVEQAMARTGGDLTKTPLFSALAPEFGRGLGESGPLRSLVDPDRELPLGLHAFGPGKKDPEPHDLSVVLSRAFYALVLDAYDARLHNPPQKPRHALRFAGHSDTHADALRFAVRLVQRLLYRGLDYLPPGDVTFVDLARAVLACDRAAHPEDTTNVRGLLIDRLVERGIGATEAELDTPFEALRDAVGIVQIGALAGSDWYAMRWVELHRAALGIPDGVPFDVLPRERVRKVLIRPTERPVREELLLKVSWRVKEPVPTAGGPSALWVRHGLTVAFDAASGSVCGWVRTAGASAHRDQWVGMVCARDASGVTCHDTDGAYEICGSVGLLHARMPGARSQRLPLPDAPAGVDATAFRELWRGLVSA